MKIHRLLIASVLFGLCAAFGQVSNVTNVATIAKLRLFAGSGTATANVAGYYAPNDGGGGLYVWNSTSTAADNGGTIIAPNAGGTGRWLLQYDGVISVTQFGAVGDGTTDDGQAFANAVAVNNGVVDIPAKPTAYVIGRALVFPGSSTTVYGMRGVGGVAKLKFQGVPSSSDLITAGGLLGGQVLFRDLDIDCGNGTTSGGTCGRDGLVILGGERPHLDNIHIYGAQRDGIALSVANGRWIQKLYAAHVHVEASGRHGLNMAIANDNTGTFINESSWRSFEVHGVSQRYNGGSAINAVAAGTNAGSKISQTSFYDTSIDLQRATSVSNGFDVSPYLVHCVYTSGATNNYEIWRIIGGGWETTSGSAVTGDMIHVDTGASALFWEVFGISVFNVPGSIYGLTDYLFHNPTESGGLHVGGGSTFEGDSTLKTFSTLSFGVTAKSVSFTASQTQTVTVNFPVDQTQKNTFYRLVIAGIPYPAASSGTHWTITRDILVFWDPTGDNTTWMNADYGTTNGGVGEVATINSINLAGSASAPTGINVSITSGANNGTGGRSPYISFSLVAVGNP